MDEGKRRIIVAEIKQWRQSKLLPEQYCDFLMNLYRSEQEENRVEDKKLKSILPTKPSNWKNWIFIILGIGLLALVILSFTLLNFNLMAQVAVSLMFIVFCYVVGFMLRDRMPLLTYAFCGIGSLALLVFGILVIQGIENTEPFYYISYIAVSAVTWLIIGIFGRMRVLQVCGLIALLFTYGWLLNNQLVEMDWSDLQLSYVPIALLLIWIGWFIHHRSKEIASTLLLVGVMAWIVPELYGMFIQVEPELLVMQASLIGKLFICGLLMFVLRKKWMKWVV